MTFSKFEWLKAATGNGLTGSQWEVLVWVWNHTDADGANAFAGAERVAADTAKNEKTVRRALADLTKRGILIRDTTGGRRGEARFASRYRLGSFDPNRTSTFPTGHSHSQPGVQTPPTYPTKTYPTTPNPCLDMSSTGVEDVDSPSGQTNVEDSDLSLSMQGPKALNVDHATPQAPLADFPDHELRPLPEGWHINGAHVSLAGKYGINCRELAVIWRRWVDGTPTESGPRQSTNWDRFFAHLIAAIGDDEVDPDGRHFMLEEFGDVDGWWDRGSQSAIWHENTKRYPDVLEDDFMASEFDTEALVARPDLPTGKVYGNDWVVSKACRFACRDRGLDFELEIETFIIENSDDADTPMGFEKRFIRGLDRISV
ncbi:helix-turn-helix domain-containing protein [Gordonia terrae]